MTNTRIRLQIQGDDSAVEDYWDNLAHISSGSTESEVMLLIDDLVLKIIKVCSGEPDIVIKVIPSTNTEPSVPPTGQYNVQWVELVRKVDMIGDSDLRVFVKAEAPEGITAMVWAEDTWNPVLDHLKERGLFDTAHLEAFHSITEGMYWG